MNRLQPKYKQTAISSIDSYKIGHFGMFPKGITKCYSNFTPRSDLHLNLPAEYKSGKIVWFGLQSVLLELNTVWEETFFGLPWEIVEDQLDMYIPFCGPNGVEKEHFKALWELGYLPLHIKALPEGTEVPVGIPVLTITNTDPRFFWLPNFLETWLSSALWQASTSATISRAYRKIVDKYYDLTGANPELKPWCCHDFSVRGMAGINSAAMSGAGHLLSFTGTDNLPAVKLINDCYSGGETFVGGSVPATEHSVMCAGGKESEIETFRRLLKMYPSGIVSIVSDTWDFWNVITNMARELKDDIEARTPDQFGNAKVVFRPDSGDPVEIICGYKIIDATTLFQNQYSAYYDDYEVVLTNDGEYRLLEATYDSYDNAFDCFTFGKELSKAEAIGAVECLAEIFGTTTNSKGFKTLNQRVGLIYGDSITAQRAEEILKRLADKGFAADNIVFGIGSYTFQYNTRDTLGFAMKATYVEIDGVGQAIFKEPKTDSGTKKSARGLLQVAEVNGNLVLSQNVTPEEEKEGLLQRVFLNGYLTYHDTIENIRNRLNK